MAGLLHLQRQAWRLLQRDKRRILLTPESRSELGVS